MAKVLLLAVFLLSGSFPARAQDSSTVSSTTSTAALERQVAENKEETGRLKNQVDRPSSMMETLLSRVDILSAELSEEKVRSAQLEQNLTQELQELESRLQTQISRTESTIETPAATTAPPADCSAFKASGQTTSGVYTLGSVVQAYCDMDTAGGGWTVIQRRQDGSVPFNRTWEEYKQGFGNKDGEYWLGNENIHLLTNKRNYWLRLDIQDWDDRKAFAEYSTFRVSGESDGYRLYISGFSGNAGDSLDNNGGRFSTLDRDNDVSSVHCSQQYGQGGWWFRSCGNSYLNGPYLGNCGNSCPLSRGVMWYGWRGASYSLKSVSMKIREETDRIKVDRLSSMVGTLQSKQSDLTSRVDSLAGRLQSVLPADNSAFKALQSKQSDLTSMVGALQSDQSDLTSRVDSLADRLKSAFRADCSAFKASGQTTSGVYTLGSPLFGVQAYCHMDTAGGGWTVIQRRQDGSVPFNRTWEEYKHGFGDINGEYWLGNENIHLLTSQKNFTLRIDFQDWEGKRAFAEYSTFRVSGESDQYRVHVAGYSGNTRDSMANNNGQRFSTMDRDNDAHSVHCSQRYGQGGWWFESCSHSNLNGRYLGNCGSSCPSAQGVMWFDWGGWSYSLKSVSMKIRPS
ncbi:angiopoietin-related protein 7-like [Branchiostoma lanceolatum]|uniref:angiopoietin-related protein 7-like n=1 Tax=Branchiostoma lanceolatum TaxID=7740 RepID=UPI00345739D8